MDINNKTILITGAAGLVGIPTVEKCLEQNAKVIAVDIRESNELTKLKQIYPNSLIFEQVDLTFLDKCQELFKKYNIDITMHIAGIKGNPSRAANCPADYFFPMLMFNTNIIHAAYHAGVKWFVYLSSVGVYHPADIMNEDSVWDTMPSKNDWYPGWAKRAGELALQSLQRQYNWNNFTIIRPANIFGEDDNFSPDATVISSNVYKLFNSTNFEIECWGDGSAKRDFVFARDVADATVDVVKKEINDIINFGSGNAISIKDTIETLVHLYKKMFNVKTNIVWDKTKPNGDLLRCLSSERQKKYNILPKTEFIRALELTLQSYHKKRLQK